MACFGVERSWFEPWAGLSWARHALNSHSAYLGVSMGTSKFNAGVTGCDGLATHPERSRNIPSRFMPQKPGQAPAFLTTCLVCRLYLVDVEVYVRAIYESSG